MPLPQDICDTTTNTFLATINTYVRETLDKWRNTAVGELLSLLSHPGSSLEISGCRRTDTKFDILGRSLDEVCVAFHVTVWPSGVGTESDAETAAAIAAFYMVAQFPYISMRDTYEFVARGLLEHGCTWSAEETVERLLDTDAELLKRLACDFRVCEQRLKKTWLA
jgi:hypothetical protein